MSLLSTHGLTVHIGGRAICTGLDLGFGAGESWALLGCNGAGKTTLLHTLAGLRPVQQGDVHLDGTPLARWSQRALARRRGVLLQDSQDTFPATVLETVLAGRHPHLSFWASEGAEDVRLARAALDAVDLGNAHARIVTTLSGGERRRVAIATLLVQAPSVWLLDEPSNHLDLHHQVRLLDLLVQRARSGNGCVVMSLHDVNLAERFCTHAVLLVGENTVVSGPAAEVINAGNLARMYGHEVRELRAGDGARAWLPA